MRAFHSMNKRAILETNENKALLTISQIKSTQNSCNEESKVYNLKLNSNLLCMKIWGRICLTGLETNQSSPPLFCYRHTSQRTLYWRTRSIFFPKLNKKGLKKIAFIQNIHWKEQLIISIIIITVLLHVESSNCLALPLLLILLTLL